MLKKAERSVSRGREPIAKKFMEENEENPKRQQRTSKGSRSSSTSSSSSSSSYSSSSSQEKGKAKGATKRGRSRSSSSSRGRRSYSSSSYSSRSSFSSRSRSRSPFSRRQNRFRGRSFSRSISNSRSRSPYGARGRRFRGRPRSFSRSRSPPQIKGGRGTRADRGRFQATRRRSPSIHRSRRHSPSPPPVIKSVLVSNLSFNLSKEHVEEILGEFGKTTSVQMRVSRNMNNLKKNDGEGKNDISNANSKTENGDNDVKSVSVGGIMDVDESSSTAVINSVKKQLSCQQAIVEYESIKDAENAIKGMSGGVIDGCLVTVTLATINDLKSENAAYSTGFSTLNRRPSKPNPKFNNDAERRRMQPKRVPSPYGRRPAPSSRRSPSPFGRRPGPPSRRRSPPPYGRGSRRRSPSPFTRRNRSPLRKRSLSPRSRSRSPPIRRRSRTPPIIIKKEQQPAPIRSFVNPERLKNVPV